MATSGQGSGVVGYNVHAAVDTEHHLITTHEIMSFGNHRSRVSPMAKKTLTNLDTGRVDIVAGHGYFNVEEILACAESAIIVALPKPMASGNKAKGGSVKADFRYLADKDPYVCPAVERFK